MNNKVMKTTMRWQIIRIVGYSILSLASILAAPLTIFLVVCFAGIPVVENYWLVQFLGSASALAAAAEVWIALLKRNKIDFLGRIGIVFVTLIILCLVGLELGDLLHEAGMIVVGPPISGWMVGLLSLLVSSTFIGISEEMER